MMDGDGQTVAWRVWSLPNNRIPKKQKPDGDGKASAPSKPTAKLCQNCAKWAPAIKNTHNTAQCLKFKADGTRLDGHPNKTLNVHGHDDEILSAFHTMRKEQKALRKQRAATPLLTSPPIPTVIRKRGTTGGPQPLRTRTTLLSASSSRLMVLAWTVVPTKR